MDDPYFQNIYHHEEPSFASGYTSNSQLSSHTHASHTTISSIERKLAEETEAYLREHRSTGSLKTLLHIATQNLLGEQNRADEAVAQVHELTSKMKEINDAKRLAVREAERAINLLQEYKTRYEEAQREILIAQRVFNEVDERRRIAEQELADSKVTIRRLNQNQRVWNAREEGRKQGLEEGWTRGWQFMGDSEHLIRSSWDPPAGYPPGNRSTMYSETSEAAPLSTRHSEGPNTTTSTARDTRRSQTSESPPQREHVSSNGPSPPLPTQLRPVTDPAPIPHPAPQQPVAVPAPDPRPIPVSVPAPVPPPVARHHHRTSPPREETEYVPGADDIRPIIVQTIGSPSPRHPPVALPPDAYIPNLGSDMRLHIPPPHEFSGVYSPEPPPSPRLPTTTETSDTEPPLMIHPDPSPETRRRRSQDTRHSSADSFSTDFSQLSLIRHSKNDPIISPLSAIQEVRSGYTSPNPQSLRAVMDHQGVSGHQTPRSVSSRQQTRQPSARTSMTSSSRGDLTIDIQGPSPPASTQRDSRPISASLSGWGGPPPLGGQHRVGTPASSIASRQPSPKPQQQPQPAYPQPVPVYHMSMPAAQGSVLGHYGDGSSRPTHPQTTSNSSGRGTTSASGSNTHYRSSGPPVIPDSSLFRGGNSQVDEDDDDFDLDEDDDFQSDVSRSRSGRGGGGGGGDDDDDRAVSSGMSSSAHDSLMTPKERRKRLSGEGSVGRSTTGYGGDAGGSGYSYQAPRSTGAGSRKSDSRTTSRSGR